MKQKLEPASITEVWYFNAPLLILIAFLAFALLISISFYTYREVQSSSDMVEGLARAYNEQSEILLTISRVYQLEIKALDYLVNPAPKKLQEYQEIRNKLLKTNGLGMGEEELTVHMREFYFAINQKVSTLDGAIEQVSWPEKRRESFLEAFLDDSFLSIARTLRQDVEARIAKKEEMLLNTKQAVKRSVLFQVLTFFMMFMFLVGFFALLMVRQRRTLLLAQAYREESERAKAATRAKGEFLATMSHEIRTPLNAIIGFTDLLLREKVDEEKQAVYLTGIHKSGNALLTLLNDILDLSKIEAGKLEIQQDRVDIQNLLKDLESMFRHEAEKKGLSLILDPIPPDLRFILLDKARLRQVLVNLIGNALKFTSHGSVRYGVQGGGVEVDANGTSWCELIFYVSDTGIGIPKDKLTQIFEPFMQADSRMERKYGGTGLGLAISQRLSQAMGGTLEVESEPGVGSNFTLKLKRVKVFPSQNAEGVESQEQMKTEVEIKKEEGTREKGTDAADYGRIKEILVNSAAPLKTEMEQRLLFHRIDHALKSGSIDAAMEIAEDIEEIGQRLRLEELQQVGADLGKAVRLFDLQKMKKLLHLCGEFSSALREKNGRDGEQKVQGTGS